MGGILHNVVTVATAGTAVRFTTATTPIKSILIAAPSGNTGAVYIGDSTVASTNSPPLAAGSERTITFKDNPDDTPGDMADLYVDVSTNGDTITYFAVTL